MKFNLTASNYSYTAREVEKMERLGFKFALNLEQPPLFADANRDRILVEPYPEIEIASMEEILKLSEEFGPIIIDAATSMIEIYNGYRE